MKFPHLEPFTYRSGPFSVSDLAEMSMRLVLPDSLRRGSSAADAYCYVSVIVTQEGATTTIRVKAQDRSHPPYRLSNATRFPVLYQQKVRSTTRFSLYLPFLAHLLTRPQRTSKKSLSGWHLEETERLKPGRSAHFAWWRPSDPHSLCLSLLNPRIPEVEDAPPAVLHTFETCPDVMEPAKPVRVQVRGNCESKKTTLFT